MMKEEEKHTTLDTEQCKWWVNHLFNIAKEKAFNANVMDDAKEIQSAQDKIIKVLEQEPKWIPVNEKLPKERIAVLVWCPERKNIYCACYEEKHWWIFGAYFEKIELEVIAWMPLPEAYKEGE